MAKLSKLAQRVEFSKVRKMFDEAAKLDDVVSFALGEPDFTTPDNIIAAANQALAVGETHYTANSGIVALREAIAKRLRRDDRVDYNPSSEIIVTTGGVEALILAMMVILDPGDEVIVTDPCWPNHPGQVKMCGAIPVFVPVLEEDGFVYNLTQLRAAITPKTKAILLNSPANPTGSVATYDDLAGIAKLAVEHDLFVISDEVYRYFTYDGAAFFSISSFPGMKERTLIVDSFSKSYAMTGWRVGYVAAPAEFVAYMSNLQEHVCSCVNTPAQYGAIEALEGPQDSLEKMIRKYAERRELIVTGINAIEGLSCRMPKGAFYAFINLTASGLSSDEFTRRLMLEEGVVIVPGTGFGEAGEGFARISYATSEENIREGLRRIEHFMAKLRQEQGQ
ncbi:MAG: pyridoxal phosphate-dependent aminotransferase [Sporomusaceae bacterium]|nr:pyridoxal phosphate-dependent aminotransferase [Sporomusaceae bacterium]